MILERSVRDVRRVGKVSSTGNVMEKGRCLRALSLPKSSGNDTASLLSNLSLLARKDSLLAEDLPRVLS